MMEKLAEQSSVYENVEAAIRLTRQGKYPEALAVFEEMLPQLSSRDAGDRVVLANASSYCGLCVAMVERKYAQAVEYCTISIRRHQRDPDHRANLALVYLERNDRGQAVKHLDAALEAHPRNPRIKQIYTEIGQRQRPVIPFLSRDNPLNQWLGRSRANKQNNGDHS